MINFGNNTSMSSSNGKNKVTINGKTIDLPSGNISMSGNEIFVNGKKIDINNTDLQGFNGQVNVAIEGDVNRVECSGSVEVKGNVKDYIDCGGSCNIVGSVEGNIGSGGSVNINGSHVGKINAGGSVIVR